MVPLDDRYSINSSCTLFITLVNIPYKIYMHARNQLSIKHRSYCISISSVYSTPELTCKLPIEQRVQATSVIVFLFAVIIADGLLRIGRLACWMPVGGRKRACESHRWALEQIIRNPFIIRKTPILVAFSRTGCQVTDIDLITSLNICYNWVTDCQSCVCNNTAPKDINALRLSLRTPELTICSGPCIVFPTGIFSRGVSGFVSGCPGGIWVRKIIICPLRVRQCFTRFILYMYKNNLYGGLFFSRTGCQVTDIDLITSLNICYNWVTDCQSCVCNNTAPKDINALRLSLRTPELTICSGPCIVFPTGIFSRGVSGFVSGCPGGIWGRKIITCPLRVRQCFTRFILYMYKNNFNCNACRNSHVIICVPWHPMHPVDRNNCLLTSSGITCYV